MPPKCPYCNEEVQFIQFYPESVKFLITSVFVTCLMECPKCKIQFKQEYWYQRKESLYEKFHKVKELE